MTILRQKVGWFFLILFVFELTGLAAPKGEICSIKPGAFVKKIKLHPYCGGKEVSIAFEKIERQDAISVYVCLPELKAQYNNPIIRPGGDLDLLLLNATKENDRSLQVMHNSSKVATSYFPDDRSEIVIRTLGQNDETLKGGKSISDCDVHIAYLGYGRKQRVKISSPGTSKAELFDNSDIPLSTAGGDPSSPEPASGGDSGTQAR